MRVSKCSAERAVPAVVSAQVGAVVPLDEVSSCYVDSKCITGGERGRKGAKEGAKEGEREQKRIKIKEYDEREREN